MDVIDGRGARIYAVLAGDDSDERACRAIPDSACHSEPASYLLNLSSGACSKLAEQLASPNLVLPWLLSALGAGAGVVGFLVPVRQAGALLPQLAVAARIRRLSTRKWAWAGAAFIQAAALLLMLPAVWLLSPLHAGVAIVVLLAVFSLASGVGSVSFQDVMAKTIDRGRRGSLLGQRASIGGIFTLVAAVAILYRFGPAAAVGNYLLLVVAAAILWLGAGVFFAAIPEQPGATEGGRNILSEMGAGLRAFRDNGVYRSYLLTRAALVPVELAVPFYAIASQRLGDGLFASLGALMFATGLAHFVSSPVWGRVADRSGRLAMAGAGAASAVAAAATLVALSLGGAAPVWLFAPIVFVAAIAEAGARTGRKTYLADGAPDDERPVYIAFGNSLSGIVMLAGGLLGVVADAAGLAWTLGLILALSLLGAGLAAALPPAESMSGESA